jgi:hypothetical protein
MPRIFFDTEFTGLTDDAKLISIGLVDESGRDTFYAETVGVYEVTDCNEFCVSEVLVHLEHGDASKTLTQLRRELTEWLTDLGPNAVLVCDSPRDVGQLYRLLPSGLPKNCSHQVLGLWGNLKRRIFNAGRRLHKKHGLRVHHALDDAQVNRMILAGR